MPKQSDEERAFWNSLYDTAKEVASKRQKITRRGTFNGEDVTVVVYRVHEYVPVRVELKVKPNKE